MKYGGVCITHLLNDVRVRRAVELKIMTSTLNQVVGAVRAVTVRFNQRTLIHGRQYVVPATIIWGHLLQYLNSRSYHYFGIIVHHLHSFAGQ